VARRSSGGSGGQALGAAPAGDPETLARDICLRQLTAGPRTRAQLAEVLSRRQVPADAAERVLERLVEVGLVDDVAFAEAWVRSRHAGRGLARRALRHELRHRGVPGELVDTAVEELEPEQELATARTLVARRLLATRGLPPATRARRLAGVLARKGYPAGVAARVVREALAADGAADGSADERLTEA
jgi:regulatory protein